MSLKGQLQQDMIAAMKAKETVKRDTLRLVISRITQLESAGKTRKDLTDQQVQEFLQKEVKTRKDSEQIYATAGETERAEREATEVALLSVYLPTMLTEEATRALVRSAVDHGATNIGMVMKSLAGLEGLDRGVASRLAREMLAE